MCIVGRGASACENETGDDRDDDSNGDDDDEVDDNE